MSYQEAAGEEWRFGPLWEWACENLMEESPGKAKGTPQIGVWALVPAQSSRCSWVWRSTCSISHLRATLDGVGGRGPLHLQPGDVVGQIVSQLLHDVRDGALQRESPAPGHEASGACPGFAPEGHAHPKLGCADRAQRGTCKDRQPGKGRHDLLSGEVNRWAEELGPQHSP